MGREPRAKSRRTALSSNPTPKVGSTSSVAQELPSEEADGRQVMLDLFSGTGSVGKVFAQRGYKVVSFDNMPRARPSILVDVLEWYYKSQFKPGHFDVIFCSPPCEHFSQARTTAPRDLDKADQVVQKALEIIRYFKPRKWFLENPRKGLLLERPYMAGIPFVDVDYCQFSDWGYQKPTRVWGDYSVTTLEPCLCDGHSCAKLVQRPNGRLGHREVLGGNHMRFSRRKKYRVPEALVEYL